MKWKSIKPMEDDPFPRLEFESSGMFIIRAKQHIEWIEAQLKIVIEENERLLERIAPTAKVVPDHNARARVRELEEEAARARGRASQLERRIAQLERELQRERGE